MYITRESKNQQFRVTCLYKRIVGLFLLKTHYVHVGPMGYGTGSGDGRIVGLMRRTLHNSNKQSRAWA